MNLQLLVYVKMLDSLLFSWQYEACHLNSLPFLISVFLPFFPAFYLIVNSLFLLHCCFKLVLKRENIGKDSDAGRDWGKEEKGTTGWDGWMASPTWQTWVWVNSRSWWWTGRPGMLWFMELQRVGHNWVAELNWTERSRKMDKLSSHWSKPKDLMGHSYCANPGKWGMLWWTFPHEGPHLLGILSSSTSGNLY